MHATPATAGLLYVGKDIIFPVTIQGNTIHIIKIKKDTDESCGLKSFISRYAEKKGMGFDENPLHLDEKPLQGRFIVIVPTGEEDNKWVPALLTKAGVQALSNSSKAGTPEDARRLAQNLADVNELFWVPNFYGSMKSQNYIKC